MKDIFLVDADETLLDFCRAEREALAFTLRMYGVSADERLYSRYHAINDELWKALERGELTRERLVVKRFELLFDEFSLPLDPQAFAEDYFARFAEGAFLLDGAEAFLRALKALGRIYIVTNGASGTQNRRLKKSGISAYADGVFISEEIGCYKPSAAYADHVESHIPQYARARAVWIGDSLTSDFACANSRGIDFILYCPQGEKAGYTGLSARSYAEVLALIGGL